MRAPVRRFRAAGVGDLRQPAAVGINDVDVPVDVEVHAIEPAPGEDDLRPVRRPSRVAPPADGSEFGPPQAELGWTFTGRRPVPSLWTTQSELCTSGVTCREKTRSLPCGDQSNVQQLTCIVGGRIRLRPVPFRFTTKTPS